MSRHITCVPLHELLAHLPAGSAFRGLQNPDVLHSSVMRLFGPLPQLPGSGARSAAGVLFRVEPVTDGVIPFVLIRSKFAPVVTTSTMRTGVDLPNPGTGATISFRVAVNAVRRARRTQNGAAGITPVPADELPDYLAERLTPALSDVVIFNHSRTVIGLKGNGRAPVQTDLFDGIAVIADMSALELALEHGVGRAKNFGCGMLTVRAM
jgi:CRISPR system Cascade subunit CasE